MQTYRSDVLVVGGGIAGITTALGLLDSGKSVVLLDRDEDAVFGGLARESFGGMFFVDTPEQRRMGVRDSTELALRDWFSFGEFGADDHWPKAWAQAYVNRCTQDVYHWVRQHGIGFFPVVNWVERGSFAPATRCRVFTLSGAQESDWPSNSSPHCKAMPMPTSSLCALVTG